MPAGSDMRDIAFQRATAGEGVPCRKAVRAVGVFYIVAALLNGEALVREAELMPYGRPRDACVAVVKPLAFVGRVTGLGWFRNELERIFRGGKP